MASTTSPEFGLPNDFLPRHIGVTPNEISAMLKSIGLRDLGALVSETVPAGIRLERQLDLPARRGEDEVIDDLRTLAADNLIFRSFLGMGYASTITPAVIQRNVLENPGWYTQYTPYQAEIAQGRLEALLNFQTMVADLTGLPLSNSSLLDEGTAAAEAMTMCRSIGRGKRSVFFADEACHPQTLEVLQTRAEPLGMELRIGDPRHIDFSAGDLCGVLVQYPNTYGQLDDWSPFIAKAHDSKTLVVMATDLLALTLFRSPGEMGADIAVGNSQRFGVPLGAGGPHAAFLATHEGHRRQMPGRIVGVSKDVHGKMAYRLALQTREQHIRRDRATSNICTAQVLLAIMASMYAVYHGPEGLKRIAGRIRALALTLKDALTKAGISVAEGTFFDTIRLEGVDAKAICSRGQSAAMNFRFINDQSIGIALDETSDLTILNEVITVITGTTSDATLLPAAAEGYQIPEALQRHTKYLEHPIFNRIRSEHEMLRYLYRLQSRDLSLTTSMIPLGSCTMKLNATSEMVPVSWPEFGQLHPFAPKTQMKGYEKLIEQLEGWLAEITGFQGVSVQPNAGSQGEYAGLLLIRAYHHDRGEKHRNICLIPTSAHGTNPASAVMAGMKVIPVKCDERGDIDMTDLAAKAAQHADALSALMVTYPSTHGVFETTIAEVCDLIHGHGGLVYLDGANMNAQVGLCRPGDFGADVCHLNLHKTFCIPHGGGGPGVGPIAVAKHLVPYLPGHGVSSLGGQKSIGAVSAAPYGSPSILPISYAYIALMGAKGLELATQIAILNANYMAERLRPHYDILFTAENGRVAHEFILDCRDFKASAGITVDDIAKRLIDFGFHAPTMSWPVAGTLMVEPTESESKGELDRFCDAMIAIRKEIADIESGEMDTHDNPLKNAPHTAIEVGSEEWHHPYSRTQAAWPVPWLKDHKFWPVVGRVDNAFGDRNLMCSCPTMDQFEEPQSQS